MTTWMSRQTMQDKPLTRKATKLYFRSLACRRTKNISCAFASFATLYSQSTSNILVTDGKKFDHVHHSLTSTFCHTKWKTLQWTALNSLVLRTLVQPFLTSNECRQQSNLWPLNSKNICQLQQNSLPILHAFKCIFLKGVRRFHQTLIGVRAIKS